MGGAGLRHRAHRRAELVVFARHAADRRTSTETEKSLGGRRVHESRARALRPQSHPRRDVIVGCVIGGALALFSIVFLMPHMETIASLVFLVACAAAIAGWVAAGSERISYAGLQIAFAFFYSVFQGYAPDTDLDNVRNRVVGILFGLIVTGVVFKYIWPERTIDRLRAALRAALQQLARLVEIPRAQTSIEAAKTESHALIGETAKSFDQARRYSELTRFEFENSREGDRASLGNLKTTLSGAERVFSTATSLVSAYALNGWRQLPSVEKNAESELRSAASKRIERAATTAASKDDLDDFAIALDRWQQSIADLPKTDKNRRTDLLSQIAAEVEQLG